MAIGMSIWNILGFNWEDELKYKTGIVKKEQLDDAEYDLKKIGVWGWWKTARERNAWKLILKEARVLYVPLSQWKEINYYAE
jgi:hypothetical protein